MRVYRIARAAYRALDGEGARRNGGRWNEPGIAMVYAASSVALAALEALVHVDALDAPADLMLFTIDVPDGLAFTGLEADDLPHDWAQVAEHPACVAAGSAWARARATVGCWVPSAPAPEDRNLLLNPAHPEVAGIRVIETRPFTFDPRLLA